MNFHLQCRCGATCWVPGEYDPDTNAVDLDETWVREWDGGDPDCDHEEYSVTDEEAWEG